MKKWITGLAASSLLVLGLAGCGTSNDSASSDKDKLVVSASNVPHAEILEEAKPILKKKGIDLEIKVAQDYIIPNKALANKEVDANYFQHVPYMESVLKDNKGKPGYNFVNAGAIHVEPIGIYSKKYKSLKDLPEGGKVKMRNAVSEEGRILSIFEQAGVIKLKKGVSKVDAQIKDIVENPKHLKFEANVEAGILPQVYKRDQADAVVINANYALDAGLDPVKDPIAVESTKDNPYANIITVRKGDENKKKIKELVAVLQSKEIKDFIKKEYKGAVLPVSK
ncbi:MetQ/NlpA family ABC transporter substrate-binding protein [Priestia koreensis]|uniref:MetQ/NlpA family ABC transporter substrate-binding protein n=1 Tax=Priestia koreensis TaxID=284581 RepID=UPI001F58CA83|nr:MetQ/NlpA family ABC transporter substrate-binding protein [Priestia koreensis]MCM3004461.1 MetQ/NlpA family ABC transporter substrate-binding protein [Priestia koreensis]UNL84671.1 MetQ/NlpA family ABC transporter substrate-binding protein [Priestia koreensis]